MAAPWGFYAVAASGHSNVYTHGIVFKKVSRDSPVLVEKPAVWHSG